jgi:hypothetical protein
MRKQIDELEAQLLASQQAVQASAHSQEQLPLVKTPELAALGTSDQHWHNNIDDIPAGATVWVTFVNGDEKYRDLMMNWAYHLRTVNVPHMVVAFDDVAATVCQEKGIPYLRCSPHVRPSCIQSTEDTLIFSRHPENGAVALSACARLSWMQYSTSWNGSLNSVPQRMCSHTCVWFTPICATTVQATCALPALTSLWCSNLEKPRLQAH